MQVITKMLWNGLDLTTPVATEAKGKTVLDKKLKQEAIDKILYLN